MHVDTLEQAIDVENDVAHDVDVEHAGRALSACIQPQAAQK